MEATWREIAVLAVGSGGAIGGVISVLVFITGRFDKRKERQDGTNGNILTAYQGLMSIKDAEVGALKAEIKELKAEVKALEQSSVFSLPKIRSILDEVHKIQEARSKLNLLFLSQKEIKIVAELLNTIETGMHNIENLVEKRPS